MLMGKISSPPVANYFVLFESFYRQILILILTTVVVIGGGPLVVVLEVVIVVWSLLLLEIVVVSVSCSSRVGSVAVVTSVAASIKAAEGVVGTVSVGLNKHFRYYNIRTHYSSISFYTTSWKLLSPPKRL